MSLESVAREPAYRGHEEGITVDGVLINFKLGAARRALRDAVSSLEEMLTRLNARPGTGVNFTLIYEIGRAERHVADAKSALRQIESEGRQIDQSSGGLPT